MIHVGQANHTGNMNDTIPAMGTQPYCFMSKYTKQIKEAVSIPVSSVGRIVTPENAEALIEKWCLRHRGSGTLSSGRSGLCKETRSRRRKTHPSLYDVQ